MFANLWELAFWEPMKLFYKSIYTLTWCIVFFKKIKKWESKPLVILFCENWIWWVSKICNTRPTPTQTLWNHLRAFWPMHCIVDSGWGRAFIMLICSKKMILSLNFCIWFRARQRALHYPTPFVIGQAKNN